MGNTPNDAIRRANAAILQRIAGMPMQSGTPESASDPRNLQATLPCDTQYSTEVATEQSSPAPRRDASVLRLVWRAP